LPDVQLTTGERCLKGVVRERLTSYLPDLQKPPQQLAAVGVLEQSIECGIDGSLIFLLPSFS
jgi:hypothetical protein